MLRLGWVQFSLLLNFSVGTIGVEQFQSGVVLSRERQTTTLTEKLDFLDVYLIPGFELNNWALLILF